MIHVHFWLIFVICSDNGRGGLITYFLPRSHQISLGSDYRSEVPSMGRPVPIGQMEEEMQTHFLTSWLWRREMSSLNSLSQVN